MKLCERWEEKRREEREMCAGMGKINFSLAAIAACVCARRWTSWCFCFYECRVINMKTHLFSSSARGGERNCCRLLLLHEYNRLPWARIASKLQLFVISLRSILWLNQLVKIIHHSSIHYWAWYGILLGNLSNLQNCSLGEHIFLRINS